MTFLVQVREIDPREPVHDRSEVVPVRRDAARQDLHIQPWIPREPGGFVQSAVPSSATATEAPAIPAERGPTKGDWAVIADEKQKRQPDRRRRRQF
jgi:hypothetical protein